MPRSITPDSFVLEGVDPRGAKAFVSRVSGKCVVAVVGTTARDGSDTGLHLTVIAIDRLPTDRECDAALSRFAGDKEMVERNTPGHRVRHFWEADKWQQN